MTLLWLAVAFAAPADDVHTCLDLYDLDCARAAATHLGASAADLEAKAELEFHLGHFALARDGMVTAAKGLAASIEVANQVELYQKTVAATADFESRSRGDVTVQFRPGMDEVLLDEAFETLQAAHDRIGPVLGGAPPGGVRMELYPTAQRFIDASSLPAAAVRTTGVIALSK